MIVVVVLVFFLRAAVVGGEKRHDRGEVEHTQAAARHGIGDVRARKQLLCPQLHTVARVDEQIGAGDL